MSLRSYIGEERRLEEKRGKKQLEKRGAAVIREEMREEIIRAREEERESSPRICGEAKLTEERRVYNSLQLENPSS